MAMKTISPSSNEYPQIDLSTPSTGQDIKMLTVQKYYSRLTENILKPERLCSTRIDEQ
jgi:hypothetical protein